MKREIDSYKNHVCISKGNMKMGNIPSVSFPPIITCAMCDCHKKCYAVKVIKYSKTAKESYIRNWDIYQKDKEQFWKEVSAAIAISKVFRFFVSGDIPDIGFMTSMCQVISENPECEFLVFTKKWQIVNEYISKSIIPLPSNLHLIFSAWKNFYMENPYNLPECHVFYKDGTTTALENKPSYYCSGNCTECYIENKGCFNLKQGQQIIIKEH